MEISGKVGSVLQGRYRITGFLGRGGMGAVYQCEDLRLPGKRWAVKEMLVFDPASQEQIEESFKREAQMLSRLRHRNLPMIVDYFIEESKQYLVMECIEGENLAQLIQREGQATELQAMRWALELAQVLDYLHRQEKPVIFRDLKPDNIIITEDRHIKLVDFGLARQFDPGKRRDTQASGSVGYAPPEQWEDAAQTDERSDVYSLGATLFYVLTSRPPSPVYGSQRLRPFRANLDPSCEAVVLKCLQPEPSQRYANSGELIRDLLLWLSKQPAPSSGTPSASGRPAEPAATEMLADSAILAPPVFTPVERPSLTPPWLLRFLQTSTILFLAAASLGLTQFWAQKNPHPPAQDPLIPILAATADEKAKARSLVASKEYAKAIDELDKLITRYPEDAEAQILSQNTYVVFQKKPYYKIPVITSTLGNDREGVQFYPGLAMAQKQINQGGGVRGHLLYLDLYDTASRPDQAIEMASRIKNDQDYAVVLGPWTSQQVIATAPVFEGGGIPALAPTASDPRVWEIGKHIFTASDSDLQRVERIASYMWGNGWKTVAVFTAQDSIVSRSESDEFKEAFTKLGGRVVAPDLPYNNAAPDFADQLRVLDENAVDAVFLAEYRSDIVLQFTRLLRQGHPKLPLATQVVAFSSSIVLSGGKDVDGMLTSTYFHPDADSQRIRDFTSSFTQQFGNLRPSHREANAYDSLMLIADGINKAGFDRKKLTEYFQEIGTKSPAYPGVSGDFAPGRRLDRRTPYLVQIRDGQYRLLDNNASN
jgi:serine/threonine protein kinase/ABC-type branched-subunit amino acid transport system substrate-binding protein